jgi:hypothetical protein
LLVNIHCYLQKDNKNLTIIKMVITILIIYLIKYFLFEFKLIKVN